MRTFRSSFVAAAAAWVWLAAGCTDGGARIELPPLPDPVDAGSLDASMLPDGARPCAEDRECDDGIGCTRDICLPGGFCANAGDSTRCADGSFCNGDETCDPAEGCRPSLPRRCDDEDVCTVDACDETQKACTHEPRDFDDDGEADWHCVGGTDCDDFDATRGSGAFEVCEDTVDNDCDGAVDETEGCGRPRHDTCDDALDVSAGGTFVVELTGTVSDYALGCEKAGPRDVTYRFTITKPRAVTLVARGLLTGGEEETATIALREACDDLASERECRTGFPAQIRTRSLPAGTYFVIVQSEASARILLEARFEAPSPAPTHTDCDTPLDLVDGAHVEGDFVDVSDDLDIVCGFPDAPDLVYRITTDAVRDLEVSAISATGDRMTFAVRSVCEDAGTTLRSHSDAPVQGRIRSLPAGTYFLVLEGPASREVDFSLDLALLDPTEPLPGEGCEQAIPLTLGATVGTTLAESQDFVPVACGCAAGDAGCDVCRRDAVFRLQIDEATDLGLTVDGGQATMTYDFRSVCEVPQSQLACGTRYPLTARVRNVQPGEYWLVVESDVPTAFTAQAESLPLTVPVEASDNDLCATAIDVPAQGGLFLGDTFTMLDDYQANCGGQARSRDAAFRLVLPAAARVVARVEASHDAVLYRYRDGGEGPATCVPLAAENCNDDAAPGTTDSALDEMLEAGTYYYVVDGFADANHGPYLFEVSVE